MKSFKQQLETCVPVSAISENFPEDLMIYYSGRKVKKGDKILRAYMRFYFGYPSIPEVHCISLHEEELGTVYEIYPERTWMTFPEVKLIK